jgi:hypothetical protein
MSLRPADPKPTSSKFDAMTKYTIVPIVEGFGEVEAVPILIRRWLTFRRFTNFDIELRGPVRASGKGSLTVQYVEYGDLGVEHFVDLALLRNPNAILVLLDADKDCPAMLGQSLLARAKASLPPGFPIGVVVANREFEAWFLAAFGSPRFRQGLASANFTLQRHSIPRGFDVESIAGCKARIAEWVGIDRYEPIVHQPMLTRHLPFSPSMGRRSRSFRKLLDELERLTVAARTRRDR